jgi:hypothetical protein
MVRREREREEKGKQKELISGGTADEKHTPHLAAHLINYFASRGKRSFSVGSQSVARAVRRKESPQRVK